MSANGLGLVGSPSELMFNNTVAYPWETTVEDPSMVDAGGTYTLLFSAGVYTSSGYSEGITTCSGPLGPVRKRLPDPHLLRLGPRPRGRLTLHRRRRRLLVGLRRLAGR